MLHVNAEIVNARNAIQALVLGFDKMNHSPPRCARRAVTRLILVVAYDSILFPCHVM